MIRHIESAIVGKPCKEDFLERYGPWLRATVAGANVPHTNIPVRLAEAYRRTRLAATRQKTHYSHWLRSMTMAKMGADVIRIEPVGGGVDPGR
ncbi:MAG: hypothetical protein WB611_30505 [Stellaceae bacterium]